MSSQKILGFFMPEDGDKVSLEYSLNDSLHKSVTLKKYDDDVYKAEIVFPFGTGSETEPLEYKYKIVTNRKVILPNNGFEKTARFVNINKEEMKIPAAYFNNLQRVVRFIINTNNWIKEKKFIPEKDNISIKLLLDGKNFIEPLTKVNAEGTVYEAAIEIPLDFKEVKWQVVKNVKEELSIQNKAQIDSKGKIIKFKN